MPGQHRDHLPHERVFCGVEPRRSRSDGLKERPPERYPIRIALEEAATRAVLTGKAERLNLTADAFQHPQDRILPRATGELPSHPGMGTASP